VKTTSVFGRNLNAYLGGKRIIVNKGSTRSSKTWSILQTLNLIAQHTERPLMISVVSESMPHLKKGCIRDFRNMLQTEGTWNARNWNSTDKIYKIGNSQIEFFSADQPGKVHGPARDILYINECISLPYETYRQLAIRTSKTIFLDYNPTYEFWVDEKVLLRPESLLLHSTYADNDYLSKIQVEEIESNKSDEEWWKVYGLGQTGTKIGLIIQDWDVVSEMPSEYKKRWLGIDFGFTNDPTAIVDIRLHNGELWIDELLYAKGHDNSHISSALSSHNVPRSTPIIADSAEPKSISEIKSMGWTIEPASKGPDSVRLGLSILNRYKKHITERSINVLNEYRNYRWQVDVQGNPINIPIDKFNHGIDAQRYVVLNKLSENRTNLDYYIG